MPNIQVESKFDVEMPLTLETDPISFAQKNPEYKQLLSNDLYLKEKVEAAQAAASAAQSTASAAQNSGSNAIPKAEKGVAGGVAILDTSGKVPSGQLPAASSSALGAAKLNSSVSSTSETEAATPKAVKDAYDRASLGVTNATSAQNTANAAVPNAQKGIANGVATLDANKKLLADQLPTDTITKLILERGIPIYVESSTSSTVRTIESVPNVTSFDDLLNKPLFIRSKMYGTTSASTLKVNDLEAKNIGFPAIGSATLTTAPTGYYWVRTDEIYIVVWNGTYFECLNPQIRSATTSYVGVVQLNDTTISTSTTQASTPNAVRAVGVGSKLAAYSAAYGGL